MHQLCVCFLLFAFLITFPPPTAAGNGYMGFRVSYRNQMQRDVYLTVNKGDPEGALCLTDGSGIISCTEQEKSFNALGIKVERIALLALDANFGKRTYLRQITGDPGLSYLVIYAPKGCTAQNKTFALYHKFVVSCTGDYHNYGLSIYSHVDFIPGYGARTSNFDYRLPKYLYLPLFRIKGSSEFRADSVPEMDYGRFQKIDLQSSVDFQGSAGHGLYVYAAFKGENPHFIVTSHREEPVDHSSKKMIAYMFSDKKFVNHFAIRNLICRAFGKTIPFTPQEEDKVDAKLANAQCTVATEYPRKIRYREDLRNALSYFTKRRHPVEFVYQKTADVPLQYRVPLQQQAKSSELSVLSLL